MGQFRRNRRNSATGLSDGNVDRNRLRSRQNQPRDSRHPYLFAAVFAGVENDAPAGGQDFAWDGQILVTCQYRVTRRHAIEHPILADGTKHRECGIRQLKPHLALFAAKGFGNRGDRGGKDIVLCAFRRLTRKTGNHPPAKDRQQRCNTGQKQRQSAPYRPCSGHCSPVSIR